MREVVADSQLVAYCGLYCGTCGAYKKERCNGCHKNEKASWCKIRSCCIEKKYVSCADCKDYADPMECKKFNNFMSKIFSMLFKSDRAACINKIKSVGINEYAKYMTDNNLQSIKR